MSQLAAGLAHELNQPLAAASSYLAGTRKLIETQELAKAMEGCTKPSTQLIGAGEVIRRLRDFTKNAAFERRTEALRTLPEEAVALAMMGTRTKQIVMNLVRNAIEAMVASERQALKISAHRIDDGFIEIEVTDSGPGIPLDVLAKMFIPFTTTKSNGMGVGLALCRTIVDAHGGTISADNHPEGGATFPLTLPTT
jgi:two-component system, LuxR family, sensor kinase FixL